jgi:hypothetical protein
MFERILNEHWTSRREHSQGGKRKEERGKERGHTKTPSLHPRHPKSPLTTSTPPTCSFAIPSRPKLLSKATIICPAAYAVGRYFPFPAPESRPREFGGREFRKEVIKGQGCY